MRRGCDRDTRHLESAMTLIRRVELGVKSLLANASDSLLSTFNCSACSTGPRTAAIGFECVHLEEFYDKNDDLSERNAHDGIGVAFTLRPYGKGVDPRDFEKAGQVFGVFPAEKDTSTIGFITPERPGSGYWRRAGWLESVHAPPSSISQRSARGMVLACLADGFFRGMTCHDPNHAVNLLGRPARNINSMLRKVSAGHHKKWTTLEDIAALRHSENSDVVAKCFTCLHAKADLETFGLADF